MATQTISGAIYYKAPTTVGDTGTYAFLLFDVTSIGWTKVADHSFDFDPAAADIAQYNALKSAENSAHTAKIAALDAAIAAAP